MKKQVYTDVKEPLSAYSDREHRKILVVDDCPNMTNLIKHLLKEIDNVEIITFNDEFEALKKVNVERPDVILLDFYLKSTDGAKLKTFIDSLSPYKIPVVFMSSCVSAPIIIKEEIPEEVHFLLKPVLKEALSDLIEKILWPKKVEKKAA